MAIAPRPYDHRAKEGVLEAAAARHCASRGETDAVAAEFSEMFEWAGSDRPDPRPRPAEAHRPVVVLRDAATPWKEAAEEFSRQGGSDTEPDSVLRSVMNGHGGRSST
jgi:hypothetical protein